jgi:hypothetical protein
VVVDPVEPELRIILGATDRMGQIRAGVELSPEHVTQTHWMQFAIDKSHLPEIIEQCAAVVKTYRVRGGSDALSSRPQRARAPDKSARNQIVEPVVAPRARKIGVAAIRQGG